MLAYFAKAGRRGNGRTILDRLDGRAHSPPPRLRSGSAPAPAIRFASRSGWNCLLYYPVTTEIDKDHDDYKGQIGAFYDESAARLAAHLDRGATIAVLSEGDPLFYGSYMHLHVRLATRYAAEVVPA